LLGIEIGAGLYEARVIVPLWSAAPPQSVWEWNALQAATPQFSIDAGRRFWIYTTPTIGLLSIAALISGWRTRPEHHKWLVAATATAFVVVVATFVYFVPTLMELMRARPDGANAEVIGAKAHLWVMLNWVRAAVYVAAWLCGLRALTLPAAREANEK
jgi:hypothetical protein